MPFPPLELKSDLSGFMKEIGYDSLKDNLSETEIVLLDWPTVLKKFSMDSGVWVDNSKLKGNFHGNTISEIHTRLSRGKHSVDISVHVTSNRNSDALLLPLDDLVRTPSPFITMRRLYDGPGDLYLTRLGRYQQSSAKMVFKNIYIKIKSITKLEVRVFADYLYDVMANALVQKNEYKIPEFTAVVSASAIHKGQQFTVTVNVDSDDSDDWKIELGIRDRSLGNIDVVFSEPRRYTFKALRPGMLEIGFDIFHTKNLMSYSKKVHITILE